MNHIEQEAAKARLIREILGIESPEQLERVGHLLHSFREEEKAPCRFTVDELKQEIAAAEAEFSATGVCYTAEEVERRMSERRRNGRDKACE